MMGLAARHVPGSVAAQAWTASSYFAGMPAPQMAANCIINLIIIIIILIIVLFNE